MKDDKQINLQTPYEIKLPTCIRKTIEYQHYRYRQGQQPALASPRQTARYERIPPDGFDMAALEVTLCGGTPPPASLVPLPFQGRLYYKLANAVKIKLTTCTGKHLNANITDTGKGNNRRWQATGGQRGTSEFRRTDLTRLPWKLHFTGEPLHQLRWSPSPFRGGKI